MKAMLMLEDGTVFAGENVGAKKETAGKVILNTAVVGYQEMMTDPANAGKILVFTYPLIGNYGINPKFNESAKSRLAGFIIKEKSRVYSNWQAKMSFDDFVREQSLSGITGVDTRTLAVHLRDKGEQWGIISSAGFDRNELLAVLKKIIKEDSKSVLDKISVKKPSAYGKAKKYKYKIAVLDLGVAESLLSQIESLDAAVEIFPYNTKAADILKSGANGMVISNGPEEDSGLKKAIFTVSGLAGKIPMLGVSTGCQVLAAACGAKIKKLKLGHRGANYPVKLPQLEQGYITAQNHGLVIDEDSLKKLTDIKVTGYNLNDNTIEEIESKKLRIIAAQYLPVSPGFGEANPVLKRFIKILKEN